MKHKIIILLICMHMLGSFSSPPTNNCEKNQYAAKKKGASKMKKKKTEMLFSELFPMSYLILQ